MAIAPFLAMTAAEIHRFPDFSSPIAWMACHFSPYGLGLSNLPCELPPGALLMVDDITPPHGHDPEIITRQLTACAECFQCSGVLLDFQRLGNEETASLAKHLSEVLPCPMAVSECYAGNLNCPVFLPLIPPSVPLEEYLAPWKGREVWLELGMDGEVITLTERGSTTALLPYPDIHVSGFAEEILHCHYSIQTDETSARFTLWRTKEDLDQLLAEAEEFGITTAVGLYQELQKPLWKTPERS